jgi:hypothetical protein
MVEAEGLELQPLRDDVTDSGVDVRSILRRASSNRALGRKVSFADEKGLDLASFEYIDPRSRKPEALGILIITLAVICIVIIIISVVIKSVLF